MAQRAGVTLRPRHAGRAPIAVLGDALRLRQIPCRAKPGRGTCMTVVLPAAEVPAESLRAAPRDAAAAAPQGSLLYIEDEPVNMLLVNELVSRWPGVVLRCAATGGQGLAAARAEPPDLILLDMQLPDMTGLDVLRALKGEPQLSRTRFVGVSANAMPEDVQRALRAGVDDYWTKPLDFAVFTAGLQRLMPGGPAP